MTRCLGWLVGRRGGAQLACERLRAFVVGPMLLAQKGTEHCSCAGFKGMQLFARRFIAYSGL